MIRRVLRRTFSIARRIAGPESAQKAVDPLNRRFPGGQLKGYPYCFFKARDRLLVEDLLPRVYAEARDEGETVYEQLLQNAEYGKFDERVVEYSWVLWKLAKLDAEARQNLLDVGCVLNRDVIANYLSAMFGMIWFMNPASERLVYKDHAAYVLSDVRKHRLPPGLRFDVGHSFKVG